MNLPTGVMTESDRISVEYRATTGQIILVLTLDVIGRARIYIDLWESHIDLGKIACTVLIFIDGHLWLRIFCRAHYQAPKSERSMNEMPQHARL